MNQFGNDLGTLNGVGPPAPSGWNGGSSGTELPRSVSDGVHPEEPVRNVGALFFHANAHRRPFQVSGAMKISPTSMPAMARRSILLDATDVCSDRKHRLRIRRSSCQGRRPPRRRNGFGVVVADVDLAGSPRSSYSTPTTTAWARSQCPRPATRIRRSRSWGSSSTPRQIARARIISGAAPLLEMASPNDITQAGPAASS